VNPQKPTIEPGASSRKPSPSESEAGAADETPEVAEDESLLPTPEQTENPPLLDSPAKNTRSVSKEKKTNEEDTASMADVANILGGAGLKQADTDDILTKPNSLFPKKKKRKQTIEPDASSRKPSPSKRNRSSPDGDGKLDYISAKQASQDQAESSEPIAKQAYPDTTIDKNESEAAGATPEAESEAAEATPEAADKPVLRT
jgi:hypothetical protein